MNIHKKYLQCLFFLIIILTICGFSLANKTNPASKNLNFSKFLNSIYEWRIQQKKNFGDSNNNNLKIGAPTVLAGIFCFIAASISSAGGIGGGGLYVPILIIVAGVDLKTASSFSAFMVMFVPNRVTISFNSFREYIFIYLIILRLNIFVHVLLDSYSYVKFFEIPCSFSWGVSSNEIYYLFGLVF